VVHEELEQPVLGGPERDLVRLDTHLMACRVQLEVADVDDLAFRDGRASQRGADACEQLALRERLNDVVVCAAVEARDDGRPLRRARSA
jgi:hypothetical protein